MTDLVPFGKYRGQPVEVLAADRDYTDWLMAQPWFRERYQNIYTIVINNQQPSETPEHNALQVLFLDEAYRAAFVALTFDLTTPWTRYLAEHERELEKLRGEIEKQEDWLEQAREREAQGKPDYFFHGDPAKIADGLTPMRDRLEKYSQPATMEVTTKASFEYFGADVFIRVTAHSTVGVDGQHFEFSNHVHEFAFGIEIKPSVGDDYPAVLRQMKALDRTGVGGNCRFLFLEKYTGVGASEQQFRKVFEASGKQVVFRHEVEALL